MFEELLNLVRGNSAEAIVNNADVPNEHNDAVQQEATTSIMSTLQGMLSGGGNGAAQVLNLFNQSNAGADVSNHPVAQSMSQNLVGTLMSKFGIGGNQAGGIASMLLPMVLSKLVGGASNNTGGGGLGLQNIFNSLSGGGTSGLDIGSLVSKFGGNALDKNHDGHVDLSDLTAAFSGGGDTQNQQTQQTQQQQSGGGILDALSGLLGGK